MLTQIGTCLILTRCIVWSHWLIWHVVAISVYLEWLVVNKLRIKRDAVLECASEGVRLDACSCQSSWTAFGLILHVPICRSYRRLRSRCCRCKESSTWLNWGWSWSGWHDECVGIFRPLATFDKMLFPIAVCSLVMFFFIDPFILDNRLLECLFFKIYLYCKY